MYLSHFKIKHTSTLLATNRIYPPELKLKKSNVPDIEAQVSDLYLSISNGLISFKIYDNAMFFILTW